MNTYYFYSEGSWAGGLTPLMFDRGKITSVYTNSSEGIMSFLRARTMAQAIEKFKTYKPTKDKSYQCIEQKHKWKGGFRL